MEEILLRLDGRKGRLQLEATFIQADVPCCLACDMPPDRWMSVSGVRPEVSSGRSNCRPLRQTFARRTCEAWLCVQTKSGLRAPAWDGGAARPASASDGRIEGR